LYGYYRAASFRNNELTLFESLSIAVGFSEFLFTRSLDKDVTYQDFDYRICSHSSEKLHVIIRVTEQGNIVSSRLCTVIEIPHIL